MEVGEAVEEERGGLGLVYNDLGLYKIKVSWDFVRLDRVGLRFRAGLKV